MSEAISFCVRTTVREGRLAPLRALMGELVASAEGEPGTRCYEWFLSEDESICHIYERYADTAALLAHLGRFGAFAERFGECVEIDAVDVYGAPSPDARAALDGLGAVYLDSFGGFAR